MELVLTATLISVFASLTPGPDILLTVFNSLRFGFRHGVATTMGILCGVSLHLSAGILGISWLISHPRLPALWLRGQGILAVIVCCALALLGTAMWLNLLK